MGGAGHSDEVVQCQLFGGLGGNRIASCSYDGLLKLWHISAEQMRCIATLDGHTHRYNPPPLLRSLLLLLFGFD